MSTHKKHSGISPPGQLLSDRWKAGESVDLSEFIGGYPDLSPTDCLTIVLIDQREQWNIGNYILAEDYLDRFSQLKVDRSAAIDLIYSEYLLRELHHQSQEDAHFVARFPEFAEELTLQLQVHQLVDSGLNSPVIENTNCTPLRSFDITPMDDSGEIAWRREASKRPAQRLPEISGYQLIELVGRGGMGAVYRGWHLRLNRQVAVKIVRSTIWNDMTARERFVAEARSTARLNHPNIVQIYEVGEADNHLFFSLEYCSGGSMNEWLAGTPVSARLAAQINLPICLAVHHAHQRGIIHRDLKPANIVLQLEDDSQVDRVAANLGAAIPKVTDFGLARCNDELGVTQADAILGTPSYMSPEQARSAKEVTPLSDVYSLGAILYESLTGRPPFKGSSIIETVRQVVNDDPVAPRRFHPNLPRDIETICLKALHKDPSKRYSSALEFANDLKRFLDGLPVKARPVAITERTCRWIKRNPGWTAAIAAVMLMVSVAWQLTMVNMNQARKNIDDLLAEQQRTKLALAQAERGLYLSSIAQANAAWDTLSISSMKSFLDQCPVELRCWEWYFLNDLSNRRDKIWQQQSSPIVSMAVDQRTQQLLTANEMGELCLYQLPNPQPTIQRQLDAKQRLKLGMLNRSEIYVCLVTSQSAMVIGSMETQLEMCRIGELESTPFRWKPDPPWGISSLVLCPSKNWFAVASIDSKRSSQPGIVDIFSAETMPPTQLAQLHMPSSGCRTICFSPDGSQLAVAGEDHLIYLVDARTNEVIKTLEAMNDNPTASLSKMLTVTLLGKRYNMVERGGVDQLKFSPDGRLLVAGLNHGVTKVWDIATNQLLYVFQCEDDHVGTIRVSEDSQRLAVASATSSVIHVYDLQTGRQCAAHQGHQSRISAVDFSSNHELCSTSLDGSIRRWGGSDQSNNHVLVGHSQSVLGVAFHPQGKLMATADGSIINVKSPGSIRFWDLQSRDCIGRLETPCSLGLLSYDPAGNRLAVAGGDGAIRIFHSSTDQNPTVLTGHSHSVMSLAWSPTRNEMASVSGSLLMAHLPGEAIIWDTGKMEQRLNLVGHTASLSSVVFSPDGTTVVTSSADKTVRVWDAQSGQCRHVLTGPDDPVIALVFDPHGRWLAGGTGDIFNPLFPKPGEIHIWNSQTWQPERVLKGHNQLVHGLSVTSDGKRLISCARNDKIRLWEVESGVELLTLTPTDYACGVFFSPDRSHLAVPNWGGKIDLFSAEQASP